MRHVDAGLVGGPPQQVLGLFQFLLGRLQAGPPRRLCPALCATIGLGLSSTCILGHVGLEGGRHLCSTGGVDGCCGHRRLFLVVLLSSMLLSSVRHNTLLPSGA